MKRAQHRSRIDALLTALVLVKIGQDLGTHSDAARAVHRLLESLAALLQIFFG